MTGECNRWAVVVAQESIFSKLPRRVEGTPDADIQFSICTLVTDEALYHKMSESFRWGGFDGEDVEFLYVDNISTNSFDAYAGLNCLISHARGEFVILCHQDVVLLEDGRGVLLARLRELDVMDPSWALAGNAGGIDHRTTAVRITDRTGTEHNTGTFPHRAISLDENFIVMRSVSRLGFSSDLNGFHLYGTDICLQAEARGRSAYVIDFHLRHDGHGAMGRDFDMCRSNLEEKYSRLMRTRALKTTCTTVDLAATDFLLRLSRFWRDVRRWRRIVWKRMRGKPIT